MAELIQVSKLPESTLIVLAAEAYSEITFTPDEREPTIYEITQT